MENALPWKEVLDGIERTLIQVEAAAAAREADMEGPGLPPPLASDSAWQTALLDWDTLVAKLPAAAEMANSECRATEATLGRQEETLHGWLQAAQINRQELAAWDERYVAGASHTIRLA